MYFRFVNPCLARNLVRASVVIVDKSLAQKCAWGHSCRNQRLPERSFAIVAPSKANDYSRREMIPRPTV
jgi:hypothetical protein